MKRKLVRENRNATTKYLREGERSEQDIKALKDIQSQIDFLIEELMSTKVTSGSCNRG
jgi:hypothetical protein